MSIARQASEITLPAINNGWATVLQFLCSQFPFISEATWQQRIAAGKVHWFNGAVIAEDTPFSPSKRLCYYREVAAEPQIPLAHHILYQDAHLIVADKPHFLPVTPGGDYVNECLLARLQRDTGLTDIAPLHRLDRDTAGLVLFSVNPVSRPVYYQLFSQQQITKQYQAVASLTAAVNVAPVPQHWHIANRIEKSLPRFVNAIVPGEVNAISDISLLAKHDSLGLFQLTPHSGKTHQLRLHMLSLGMPILHDNYYPELKPKQPLQFTKPLQLLAKQLSFIDPLNQQHRQFSSKQLLAAWPV